MRKFEILEHTADLKIKVFGKDKKELFENAMLGIFEGAEYGAMVGSPKIEREIKISSYDLFSLLVDFLSELLYLSEVNQEVYDKIELKEFLDTNLEGTLSGKKLKNKGIIIKGVTYHELKISQLKDGSWEAVILFDI